MECQESLTALSPHTVLALRGIEGTRFVPCTGWFQEPSHRLVYVIGVGGGPDEQAALDWNGRVVFLEPNPHRLASWLQTDGAKQVLAHPQHEVHLLDEGICGQLGRQHAEPSDVLALSLYRKFLEPVRQKIWGEADAVARIRDELIRGGDLFYRNLYSNLAALPGSLDARALWGKFEEVPAVICGAGPSLPKHVPIKGAVVLAAGSGLQALQAAGQRPHFAVALDPHPFQVSRFDGASVPVFYRGRWSPEALAGLKGPRLYVRGAGGYPVVNWLEEQMGITGPVLEEGPTATCLAVEIARAMGCDPIYTAGVDLGLRDGVLYASGVAHAPQECTGYSEAKWATEREWLAGRVTPLSSQLSHPTPVVDLGSTPILKVEIEPAVCALRESLVRCLALLGDTTTPKAICEVELLDEPAYQHIALPILQCVPANPKELLRQNLKLLDAYAL